MYAAEFKPDWLSATKGTTSLAQSYGLCKNVNLINTLLHGYIHSTSLKKSRQWHIQNTR